MKKLLIILSFFMCIFIQPSFSVSTVQDPVFTKCIVNTGTLNMRCGPSTNYAIVKTLKYGTELKAIGKITNGYIVQSTDDTIGMVSGWYISPVTIGEISSGVGSSGSIYRVVDGLNY